MKYFYYLLCFLLQAVFVFAQSVTTTEIKGQVTDEASETLSGVEITAIHLPSGTKYSTVTEENGRYILSGLRVGVDYVISAYYPGNYPAQVRDVDLTLGNSKTLNFVLKKFETITNEVIVISEKDYKKNPEKKGASSLITAEQMENLPSVYRNISDFIKLTPQIKNNSTMGQDSRMNTITINGAYFNNSFGIAGMPGERTGVAPISINSLEQIQINVSPFDVRQGNFVGSSINMITKSGSNNFKGSIYYNNRNENFVGNKAYDAVFQSNAFDFNLFGGNISGPILKNKLFFFASLEIEKERKPGTIFLSNNGSQKAEGNITRVLKKDLDSLRNFLKNNFNYETGSYENYDFNIPALRFTAKFDFNLDEYNKITLSYNHLDSKSDLAIANSTSLGFGNRRGTIFSLNFKNSNYSIVENIRALSLEWNSFFSSAISNNMIFSYRHHDESREDQGQLFPFVDILKDGITYTSFGTEPFSPYNGLTYSTIQFQDNLSLIHKAHTFLFGFNIERFQSVDQFCPAGQSIYVFNSLEDFYNDANGYISNPNRNVSSVNLKKFQYRYSNIPNQTIPIQKLKVWYAGLYVQDEWNIRNNLNLISGLRIDVPFFESTGYKNTEVDTLTFRDANGKAVHFSTDKLPNSNPLFSFRIGFNWDVLNNSMFRLRGGTGIFTGQPAFTWISNQIGNNGILTGFESITGSNQAPLYNRPFNPNPNSYKPGKVESAPASSYELSLTDPDFKFPQVWKTDVAMDYQLLLGIIGTVEFIYNKDINGIYYYNANLADANTKYSGADSRMLWTNNKIYNKIDNAIILKNQNRGYSWNLTAALEKSFESGFYGKMAYAYGKTKNPFDASTIAYVTWAYNTQNNNPNNPDLGYSLYTPDHRIISAFSYKHKFFNFGATSFGVYSEITNNGRDSYVFNGDFNGDGVYNNDLIYVPANKSEMYFKEYTSGGKTFSVNEQKEAWEKFIEQDDYLRTRRGKYAERNGVVLPILTRIDICLEQELDINVFDKKNTFVIRFDIMNFTNLLNKKWGVSQVLLTNQPLIAQKPDAENKPVYYLKSINNKLLDKSFIYTSLINDVYRMQISFRWMFN